uniref:Uncharacterized protein n=1 Tax=Nonomuraea gerenzanensis TaxID=93944 RepID=A0A1M4EFL7_9ACTN|nr:hypothetical protein BN4615_P6879 [Nonomuraea gerenzanensis]
MGPPVNVPGSGSTARPPTPAPGDIDELSWKHDDTSWDT